MEETPFHLGFHILLIQDSLALINVLLTAKNQELEILNPVNLCGIERKADIHLVRWHIIRGQEGHI